MRCFLIAWLAAAAIAVDLGKTTYNLNLIVEAGKETYEKTRDDAEKLLAHAVANGASARPGKAWSWHTVAGLHERIERARAAGA